MNYDMFARQANTYQYLINRKLYSSLEYQTKEINKLRINNRNEFFDQQSPQYTVKIVLS